MERPSFAAGFGIYHGAAQNDDLNAGLESDTFRVKVNQSIPLSPAFEQTTPDLSSVTAQKQASHPRALQRQGRRDLYAEEWGLTMEHELPGEFPGFRAVSWKPWGASVLARRRKSLHESGYV